MNYFLRPICAGDIEEVWHLSNSPEVRAVSCSHDPIAWETHSLWFSSRLQEEPVFFMVVCDATGHFAGYVRFFMVSEVKVQVSVALCANMRGKRLGASILGEACENFQQAKHGITLQAVILPTNEASIRIFEQNGFAGSGEITVGDRLFLEFSKPAYGQ